MSRQAWRWLGLAVGVVFVALGTLFAVLGLDDAAKTASVVGTLVGLAGLALTAATTMLTLRGLRRQPARQRPGQSAVDVDAAGVDMVDGASAVRIGQSSPFGSAPPAPSTGRQRRPDMADQVVQRVRSSGQVRMVRNVDGDVDLS